MGSFWGLDNAGKEAQGWPREFGAWTSQQYKDWLARGNEQYSAGDSASRWYKDYNLNRVNNGVGSIADINAKGSMIMPGVDQYVTDKNARLRQQMDDFNNLPSADDTMTKVNDATNEKGDLIRQTRDFNIKDIGDTYDRSRGTSDAAWGRVLANSELLKPGSRFQEAQVGRGFSGQIAQTAGALRRMGLSDTPQALSAMNRVYTDRSRAMDDAAAAGTKDYVTANSSALIGQQADREQLDATRSTQLRGQQNDTLGRASDWEDERGRNAMMDKALHTQDWATRGDLNDKLSNADLEAIGLRNQRFNAGMGYTTADLNERNNGALGVGTYGEQQYAHGYQSANTALANGSTANDAYKTAYSYEAPQAGWGVKMLASMAAPALAAIPGVGPYLSGAATSAAGAQAAPVPMAGPNGQTSYQMPQSGGGMDYTKAYQTFMNMFKKGGGGTSN
jgi:hypothetical protein